MELNEAIEILGTFKLADIIEIITQEEFEDVKTAIDTVLEELNRLQKEVKEYEEDIENEKKCLEDIK